MKYSKTDLERIAVAFRNAPCSPSHAQVDTFNAIEQLGGIAAIKYGCWLSTPLRSRWKKHDLGLDIASSIERQLATSASA